MKIRIFNILLLLVVFLTFQLYAQKEYIGTQQVLIIKSYTPSLSNSFKINSSPQIPDSLKLKNKILEFKIISVPALSTFVPNKATPLKLKKRSSETPFNTVFNGGFGTNGQTYLDISSVIELDRLQRFGIKIYRDGYKNDIANTKLRSNQGFTKFGIHHNLRSNYYNVNTLTQFVSIKNNYFGLYKRDWDSFLLNNINPEINRNYFKIRTSLNWYDFFIRSIEFQANLTSDNFKTSEQQLSVNSNFEIDLGDGELIAKLGLKGINTSFEQSYFVDGVNDYTQGISSLNLYYTNTSNELKFKIGAGLAYVQGVNDFDKKLLYYPKIEISYQNSKNVMIPYFSSNGGVNFNSYQSLTIENPYLAAYTNLKPTFKKYNATLGVKSSLAAVLNFDFGFIYDQIKNFKLFERLPFDYKNNNIPYRLSNAFEGKYANVNLYGIRAALQIDLTKNNYVRFETFYNHYDSTDQQILWNIPSIKLNWEGQFQWKNNLTLTFQGTLIGERLVAFRPIFIGQEIEEAQYQQEKIPNFITTTTHLTYKLSQQFDVFLKTKLNSSGIHGEWAYYNQPPLLMLAGITYKFDFQY